MTFKDMENILKIRMKGVREKFLKVVKNFWGSRKEKTILDIDEEARAKVAEIGKADILVGIPSYNNSNTIGHVIRAAEYGLAKYFPKFKAVILNSDGGSSDRTKEIVKETSVYSNLDTILIQHAVRPVNHVVTAYHGLPGKGSAFNAIFEIAKALDVKTCVVLDSDVRSVDPEWIEMLAGPIIIKGYDYVTPLYMRHKYDGTITNMVVYPLVRTLFGYRVRQPIGGDFGFSQGILQRFLEKDGVWETDVARYGIDIWMTTTAIAEGYRICQAFLGAKIHDAKDPSNTLGPMFTQVVGTLFRLMDEYQTHWKEVKWSRPTAMYGFRSEVYPEPVEVSLEPMWEKFRKGVEEYKEFWERFLPRDRIEELSHIATLPLEYLSFSNTLWAKTIFDFALAFHKFKGKKEETEKIVQSMVPLYLGKTASYVMETKDMPTYGAEDLIETLCRQFEELKPYLLERWEAS